MRAHVRGGAAARRAAEAAAAVPVGLGAGALSVLAYGLVLWAQTRGALAPIAALRETSVIFGAIIATLVFREPFGPDPDRGDRAGRGRYRPAQRRLENQVGAVRRRCYGEPRVSGGSGAETGTVAGPGAVAVLAAGAADMISGIFWQTLWNQAGFRTSSAGGWPGWSC